MGLTGKAFTNTSRSSGPAATTNGAGGAAGGRSFAAATRPTRASQPAATTNGGFQDFQGAYSVFYPGPQMSMYGHRADYLNDQQGWQNEGYGLTQQQLRSDFGFDTARNDLAQQALGIDRGAVGRQQGYYDQLFGLDRDRFQSDVAYQNALKGFRGESHGTTLHELFNQGSQIRNTAERNERDARRQATAAGAYTAQGTRDSRDDIHDDRDYGLAAVDIARAREGTSYRKDVAGIDNTIFNLSNDFAATGLNHQEQQARLRDRMGQLDIEAGRLGIDRNQLSARLEQGLARAGLNHRVSIGQLMDALQQNTDGAAGTMQSFLQQIYTMGMG